MSTENSNMNAANMAKVEVKPDEFKKHYSSSNTDPLIHLVADDGFLEIMNGSLSDFMVTPINLVDNDLLVDSLASGNSMVWIGRPDKIPADLWIGSFRPTDTKLNITLSENSPFNLRVSEGISQSNLYSAYIKPVMELGFHNINEEIRADFLPMFDARDRFGEIIGYPAVFMNYHSSSLAGGRFAGSKCWFFLFDNPVETMSKNDWLSILDIINDNFQSGIQIKRIETEYSLYHPGERANIRVRLNNTKNESSSVLIRYSLKKPEDDEFHHIVTHRRCPNGLSESEAVANLLISKSEGLYTIRVEVLQDKENANNLSIYGNPTVIERRDIGIVVIDGELKTPEIMETDGPALKLDGRSAFWVGTHYYPSSSWWEWVWRDFRPLNCNIDFAGIRRAGYRIVRIWVDPVFDEQTLSAMDASIYLASLHGIVLDVCVFTQWVRTIGFERTNGEHVSFDFRDNRDFNIYSISLRNMDLQKEYISVIASRWKNAGNIVYNLSNETYVMDPDITQMDPTMSWDDLQIENSSYRNSLVFRRWSNEITAAIRSAGGEQLVLPGYMFSLSDGGDNHIGNLDADIIPWHCYLGSLTGITLTYYDSICVNKPLILEEFGINGWNTELNYDDNVHYALASGAAAAMSYEWGVSWLAPEMCFAAIPIREAIHEENPDPRWFAPAIEIGNSWPANGVGICCTSSGFAYGSIYHGTPFPAEAAIALGRYGHMGYGLARSSSADESVYLIVPTACNKNMDPIFNAIGTLWRSKAIFGVWQEESLDSLPDSTKAVIIPFMTDSLRSKIELLRDRGIKIIDTSSENWSILEPIRTMDVSPSENTDLQVMRTINGTLYSLKTEEQPCNVKIRLDDKTSVNAMIDRYMVVHLGRHGVDFIEGSGNISINDEQICSITNGRMIIRSDDNKGLSESSSMILMATDKCNITFNKKITDVYVIINGVEPKQIKCSPEVYSNNTLMVDTEMMQYMIKIVLEEQ